LWPPQHVRVEDGRFSACEHAFSQASASTYCSLPQTVLNIATAYHASYYRCQTRIDTWVSLELSHVPTVCRGTHFSPPDHTAAGTVGLHVRGSCSPLMYDGQVFYKCLSVSTWFFFCRTAYLYRAFLFVLRLGWNSGTSLTRIPYVP
jgi:hypothetical protein